MEKLHLHQLFQELGSRLVCPHCKKKIPAQALNLKDSQGNACIFEAVCENCGNIANISALVESRPTQEAQKMNASSRISTIKNTPITLAEISEMKKALLHPRTSFAELFKSGAGPNTNFLV
ncbi:hypothetical protein HON22_05945 [Candidatus Peregrinibacteria bacterium]|nr:hypothetical protein [Candidatus Peregrinibacteria bacterium]